MSVNVYNGIRFNLKEGKQMKKLEKIIKENGTSYSIGVAAIKLLSSTKSKTKRLAELEEIRDIVKSEIKLVKPKKKKVKVKVKSIRTTAKAFQVLFPSKTLAEIVGNKPLRRTQVVAKIWDYIKKNNLQNPKNKRIIICDEKLLQITRKKEITMFEIPFFINGRLFENEQLRDAYEAKKEVSND